MKKSGWILLLILLCVAFLVSCGKGNIEDTEKGELVRSSLQGSYEWLPGGGCRGLPDGLCV